MNGGNRKRYTVTLAEKSAGVGYIVFCFVKIQEHIMELVDGIFCFVDAIYFLTN